MKSIRKSLKIRRTMKKCMDKETKKILAKREYKQSDTHKIIDMCGKRHHVKVIG